MVPGASGGKQLALRPPNGVYKQYNCVPGAVITTICLFQYRYKIILSLVQQSTSNWFCPNRLEAGISRELENGLLGQIR